MIVIARDHRIACLSFLALLANIGAGPLTAAAAEIRSDASPARDRVVMVPEGESGFYKIADSQFSMPSGAGNDSILKVFVEKGSAAVGADAAPVALAKLRAEDTFDYDVFLGYLSPGDKVHASLASDPRAGVAPPLPDFRLEKMTSLPVSRFPRLPDDGFDTGRDGEWERLGETTRGNASDRSRAWDGRARRAPGIPTESGESAWLDIPGSASSTKELLIAYQVPSSGYYALENAWLGGLRGSEAPLALSARVYIGSKTKLEREITLENASSRVRLDTDIGYVAKGDVVFVALSAKEDPARVALTCALVEWAPRRPPLRVSRGSDGYINVHEPRAPGKAVDVPARRWIEVPAKAGDVTDDIRDALKQAALLSADGAYAGIRLQRGKTYTVGSRQKTGTLFQIKDAAKIVMDGNGATLMVNGPELPRQRLELFNVSDSKSVAFCDLVVDSDIPPPFTVGEVLQVGPMTKGNQTVTFSVPNGQLDPLRDIARNGRANGYAYDPEHPGRLAHGSWSFFPHPNDVAKPLQPAGKPGVFSHTVTRTDDSIPVGSKWLVKNKGAGIVYLTVRNGAEDITLSGIEGRASGGSTLLFWTVSGVNIINCKFEPQDGNWISASSDGIHGQGREGPWLEDILIKGVCEDVMNIYGTSMVIEGDGKPNDKVYAIRRLDSGRGPNGTLAPLSSAVVDVGDQLAFFDPERGKIIGRASVEKIENGRYTLTKAIGPVVEWGEGKGKRSTMVYNLNQSGRFFIRDSRIMDSARFAVFIKARAGVIFGSLFEGLSANAILAANEPEWPEGPPAEDLWIQGSVFNHNNYDYSALHRTFLGVDPAQISVYTRKLRASGARPGGPSYEDVVSRGEMASSHIKLLDNTFMDWRGMGIAVRGARNVLIAGNTFHRPVEDKAMRETLAADKLLGAKGRRGKYAAIFLSDISGARIENNTFYDLPGQDMPVAMEDAELVLQSNNLSRASSGPKPGTGAPARKK